MGLQKSRKIFLETKLDQLWHQGYCILERWELVSWFDKERITNVVWREIQEIWEEVYEDGSPNLMIVKCDETTAPQRFVVVRGNRTTKISKMI